ELLLQAAAREYVQALDAKPLTPGTADTSPQAQAADSAVGEDLEASEARRRMRRDVVEDVARVRLQLRPGQKVVPPDLGAVADLERAALGRVPLEVRRVDLDPRDRPFGGEADDG